jgi:beta-glucosidase/6-phospho-beta-glucosidase/beta-galactosidase
MWRMIRITSESNEPGTMWQPFARVPDVCPHCLRYKEDVKLAQAMGITHYRMSISWSRIMPTGERILASPSPLPAPLQIPPHLGLVLPSRLCLPSLLDLIKLTHVCLAGDFPVNPLGVEFYNNVIDTLVANNITPFVTLYHWDLPQVTP